MENNSRDEIINLYLKGARELYPKIKTTSIFSLFSGNLEYPTSGKIELNNKFFENEISEEETYEVIHYTSLNSFIEIINSQAIRMYNCHNLNDPREIEHGLSAIDFQYDNTWIQKSKRNHFVLSTSRFNEIEKDDFNMWRLYGQNGMGIGLVFQIPKEINNWLNFTFNEIEYISTNSTSKIQKFINYHQNFQKKYPVFENIPSIIPLLASFQKDKIWSMENETRLVVHCPYDEFNLNPKNSLLDKTNFFLAKTLSHTINSNGIPVAYVQLPISKKGLEDKIPLNSEENFKENILSNHPFLQLKSIVIGPKLLHTSSFSHLIDFIREVAGQKIGSEIKIIKSNYTDLYK